MIHGLNHTSCGHEIQLEITNDKDRKAGIRRFLCRICNRPIEKRWYIRTERPARLKPVAA